MQMVTELTGPLAAHTAAANQKILGASLSAAVLAGVVPFTTDRPAGITCPAFCTSAHDETHLDAADAVRHFGSEYELDLTGAAPAATFGDHAVTDYVGLSLTQDDRTGAGPVITLMSVAGALPPMTVGEARDLAALLDLLLREADPYCTK